MIIELNIAEQKLAHYLARCRYENARKKNIKNGRIGPQSDDITDLNGVGAEIAFCKLFNIYPDTSTDDIPIDDCITHNGITIDVKSTPYKNGRLLATIKKKGKPIDSYALMIGEFPKYRFAGMIDSAELFREKNLINLGHGIGYAVEQSELNLMH